MCGEDRNGVTGGIRAHASVCGELRMLSNDDFVVLSRVKSRMFQNKMNDSSQVILIAEQSNARCRRIPAGRSGPIHLRRDEQGRTSGAGFPVGSAE